MSLFCHLFLLILCLLLKHISYASLIALDLFHQYSQACVLTLHSSYQLGKLIPRVRFASINKLNEISRLWFFENLYFPLVKLTHTCIRIVGLVFWAWELILLIQFSLQVFQNNWVGSLCSNSDFFWRDFTRFSLIFVPFVFQVWQVPDLFFSSFVWLI